MTNAKLTKEECVDLNRAEEMLAKLMVSERKAHGLSGYFFDFGMGESCWFKRDCSQFRIACFDFVRFAKDSRKGVELFRNMNGEIACRLV